MTLTQIKPLGLSKPVDLADDEKIRLGTGNDLQIYHGSAGGGSSFIDTTGSLQIHTSELYINNEANTERMLRCTQDASVELYENGTKVAETTSGGWNVEGITYSNGLDMDDNHKILLGTGDDFELYHDGTDSYIAAHVTGNIFVRSRVGFFVNVNATSGGSEHAIKAFQNGAVELYYDHSKKIETNSGGVSITGHAYFPDNNGVHLGAGEDFKIYHDGTSNIFQSNGLKNFIFRPKDTDVGLKIIGDGGVELYHDNGKKFETTSTGVTITGTRTVIDTSGTEDCFRIGNTAGCDTFIRLGSTGTATDTHAVIKYDKDDNYLSLLVSGESHGSGGVYIENGGKVRLPAGVKLGGTVDANLLDDYEEGTAVPDFANADNSIVTVNHYHYTKVGRLVHFEAKFTVGNNSDGSGFGFTLPFGQAGSRETVLPAISNRSGTTTTPFAFVVNANQSYAYAKALDGFSGTHVEYTDFAGDVILVSGTYEAA